MSVVSPPWSTVVPTGPLLRIEEAAAYLSISPSYYYRQVKLGKLPAPIKVGNRAVAVAKPLLDAVIAHRVAESLEVVR